MNTIMVVDNEKDIRDSLGEILRVAGYEVITAANGMEAMKLLKKIKVQLLLVDYAMPGMNGEELLLNLERENMRPPALVITALAPWNMARLVQRGVGYLRKPLSAAMLLSTVETLVGKEVCSGAEKTC
jgi:DNA-binding response OmpR family regulator